MRENEYRVFADKFKKDITDLLQSLKGHGIIHSGFSMPEQHDFRTISYTIKSLGFNLPASALDQVKPTDIASAYLSLSTSAKINIDDWHSHKDPFLLLNFKVCITAHNPTKGTKHYCGFHIDRIEDNEHYREPHPHYHMHYVINHSKSTKENFEWGESMQLNTPRFVYFPMDVVTGIGFVLHSFDRKIYNEMMKSVPFKKLCQKHQDVLWNAYFTTLSQHFNNKQVTGCFNPLQIFPYLISI